MSSPAQTASGALRFSGAVAELPGLLQRLTSAPPHRQAARLKIPQTPGVYLFSEGSTPIYVGQARKLRRRYDQHTGPKSSHFQASFAFLRAKRAAASIEGFSLKQKRAVLEDDPVFGPLFMKAKEEVAAMEFRFLGLADPITRTLFEVYAALHLGTEEFNSFETH